MTSIRATNDPLAVIRELVKRVELLERQNVLLYAAIDGQPNRRRLARSGSWSDRSHFGRSRTCR